MGYRQDPEFPTIINYLLGQTPTETMAVQQKPAKAPVLRVDALGREIDEHGNVISVTKPSNLSTLKVNINKQKKDAFQILKPQLEVNPEENPHFDPRMGIDKNKILRPKRMSFQFVEEGKWTRDAESLKLRSQFGEAKARELKVKQAHLAKARDDINPNLIEVSERAPRKEKPKEIIPDVEWWDAAVLTNGVYGDIADGAITDSDLKTEKLTHYIEHPRPIEPPAEAAPPPPQPLKLTKREQKKLRTQRRLAKEKEKQEMIRQGLLEPPKAKVKMSNLMKVLGSEATQDPTKLEKEIRTAAAEREQAHTDRNAARKLTPAEKREKKERKLFDDPTTIETIVSVYKINKLSHPKTRFKVEMNARENRLTGCSVMTDEMSVVVVEGKSKAIKRYGKLMLRRINWAEAVKKDEKEGEEEDDDEEENGGNNKCWLVWQGSVAKPSFHRFLVQECLTESAAKKVFTDAGVAHYWDLAVNYTED
ncbi:protein RDM16 isoform X2 [Brassica napus]|nr:protein RDM16 isoform X2 [Brassica napus]